jgi:hypothetical protein
MKTLRSLAASAAAYSLVDLSDLDPELRDDIILDASEGGGLYGIRVVEESVNGAARAPIYGVYKDGPDAERWANAKKKLGISGEDVDDAEVYATAGVVVDPRREAALREAAAQRAAATADAIRAGEDADVNAITGAAPAGTPAPRWDHTANIVDTTLAADATNEAHDPEAAAAAEKASAKSAKSTTNRSPK